MSPSYDFHGVDHFTAGTLGPKGRRVFYLQARESGELVSVKVEKQQVAALAEYLDNVLDELPPAEEDPPPPVMDLLEPVHPAWTVAQMGVAYDGGDDRIVLLLEELSVAELDELAEELDDARDDELFDDDPDDDDDLGGDPDDEPATLRVRLSRAQTRAFVARARDLVAAGRPPCRYCARPLDSADEWCPCWN